MGGELVGDLLVELGREGGGGRHDQDPTRISASRASRESASGDREHLARSPILEVNELVCAGAGAPRSRRMSGRSRAAVSEIAISETCFRVSEILSLRR
jgi:hypothetical protein